MEKDYSNGQMVADMKERLWIIRYKVMEYTSGLMEEAMKENGSTIKCMERVFIHGQTAKNTMVNS
jgi:hypothetical protein